MIENADTKTRIKVAAQRLFAERGVEAVAVREIVAAAGAKNGGSLNYYFGSKEGLIDELLSDNFRISGDYWLERWGELERKGGPTCVRDVLDVMVFGPEQLMRNPTATRFLASVLHTRRKVVTALMNHLEFSVYSRLVRYIEQLCPDIPKEVMRQRLIFLAWYLISVESAYESHLASKRGVSVWTDYDVRTNIIDTAAALVEARVTPAPPAPRPRHARKKPEGEA